MSSFSLPLLFLLLLLFNACTGTARAGRASIKTALPTKLYEKRIQPGLGQSVILYYQEPDWRRFVPQIEYAFHRAVDITGSVVSARPGLFIEVVLIERSTFTKTITEAPWVTAAYHKGRIFIPVDRANPPHPRRLTHTVTHEYAHAVIDDLTGSNAPAWLDEGLALYLEGSEQLSATALFFDWLRYKPTIPLHKLEKGFTTLDKESARHAYIQSRETVIYLLRNFGTEKLNSLLKALGTNSNFDEVFKNTYQLSFATFQSNVAKELKQRSRTFSKKH